MRQRDAASLLDGSRQASYLEAVSGTLVVPILLETTIYVLKLRSEISCACPKTLHLREFTASDYALFKSAKETFLHRRASLWKDQERILLPFKIETPRAIVPL